MIRRVCDCGEPVTKTNVFSYLDEIFECDCGLLWAPRGDRWVKVMIDDDDQVVIEGEPGYRDG